MRALESRYFENNICTRCFTQSIFLVSDDDFGENVVFALGSYDHFSQCVTSFSQRCDHGHNIGFVF